MSGHRESLFGEMGNWRRARLLIAVACVGLALGIGPVSEAQAVVGSSLVDIGGFGSGAGQIGMGGPAPVQPGAVRGGGIAADPSTGHIFVSDISNSRIDEFTAWGEFVKSWGWGVADGSGQLQTCGPAEPDLSPEASLCRQALGGSGVGQLNLPNGIALGPNGDLYVFELKNRRVQVFTESGAFVTMFGGGVDHTTGANVCSAADVTAGDTCGAGSEGTGPGEFSVEESIQHTREDYIDVAADGTVYVGDRDRIQVFEADGTYVRSLPLPEPGNPGSLAVDPSSGDLYFGFGWQSSSLKAPVRLSAGTGSVLYPLPTRTPEAMAVDPSGNVYVTEEVEEPGGHRSQVMEVDSSGGLVDECCGSATYFPALTTNVVTAAGGVDLYLVSIPYRQDLAFIEVRGPAPDKWPPPQVPPSIEAEQATDVEETSASLRATINPNFWADTSYHLEYGTAPCSGGGCQATAETQLGTGIVREAVQGEPVALDGLRPGTTYHYRFVARSGGGGPTPGPEHTFTTFAPEAAQAGCPNDAFRGGAGARTADCRAYEMVSPVDKGGGDILVPLNQGDLPPKLDQAASTGEAVTYSSYRSFGDAPSAPFTSQYLARRGAGGWTSEGISPPQEAGVFNGTRIDSNFRGFSDDLTSGWLVQPSDPTLAAGAIAGYPNLYRRDLEGGSYEALSNVLLESAGPSIYEIELQGLSADGARAVFRANGRLTANAASSLSIYQVYESFNGRLRLVSVLPNGTAASGESSVGTPGTSFRNNREANVASAVSEDGTKIYWSAGGGLYVRANAIKTVKASSSGAATFWAARPDGSQALYQEGVEVQEGGAFKVSLKLFTLASESSATLVPEGVEGVLGASRDLSRVYLVSSAALDGAAQAGRPNLYLYEAGRPIRFIATLSGEDVESITPGPAAVSPWRHLARVVADGSSVVFMSRGALTGAENIDSATGEADAEVFRYDAADHRLSCLSCSPAGEAPRGGPILEKQTTYRYASRIPTTEFQLHDPRVIAAGGTRVFFDTVNRLVPADTNEAEDVYEWEAPGTGTCASGAPAYSAAAEGCLTLVSGGGSARRSEFVDASADGRDAFFLTSQSLVGWDPGQVDLYDAREGGGLPAPPAARAAECEGEACQAQAPPPGAPGATSSEASGPGNPARAAGCRKGQVRRHGRCVKKKPARKRHRHGHHKKKQGGHHGHRHHAHRGGGSGR